MYSLSDLIPSRQKCVRVSPAQSNAAPSWWLSLRPPQVTLLQSWTQSDHSCLLNRGFHCDRPAPNLPSSSLFQTTPCSMSAFRVPYFPVEHSVCSTYCAPCERRVMPVNWWNHSLRLTQLSVYTGNCGENLLRLSYSDTYITVCIFLCTFSARLQSDSPTVWGCCPHWYRTHTLHTHVSL